MKPKWAEEGQAKHSALDSIGNPCSFTAVFAQTSKGIRARFQDCLCLYNGILLQERDLEFKRTASILCLNKETGSTVPMEMDWMASLDMDDEYEKLVIRMNPPRVDIDNSACENATIVQVDSANKHGILLEVVQVLTDLNLLIKKAYISSDGGWFMDVFHVTR